MDYTNSQRQEAIAEAIHNAAHRRILKLRLIDGMTYEAIAESMEMSPRQIGYILAKTVPKVYDYLRRKFA